MKNLFLLLSAFGLLFINCNNPTAEAEHMSTTKAQNEKRWTPAEQQLLVSELNRTTRELLVEITLLTDEQWTFREAPDRWSIEEIVEHLTLQNELHFREISVIANTPQLPQYIPVVEGKDDHFTGYATDPTKGKARWYLEPVGRWGTKEKAQKAFLKARSELTRFVEQSERDFRKHFTFRKYVEQVALENIKVGEVRDLHQLVLTGIAHTDRHLHQIRKIKTHTAYPQNSS